MTNRFCTSCGTVADPGVAFCTSCGAAMAASPPSAGEAAPAPAPQPTPGPGQPSPAAGQPPSRQKSSSSWLIPVVIVGLVLSLGAGVLLAVTLLGDDSPDSFDTVSLAIDDGSEAATSSDVDEGIDEEYPNGALTQLSITGPRSGAELEAATVTVTASVRSGVDEYRIEVDGEWVVSLGSFPSDHPQDQLDAELADLRAVSPDVRLMPANDWPSLTPDYWVFYIGPYDTAAQTWDACHDLGLDNSSDCFGAPISSDPDDRSVRIYPQSDRP